MQFLPALARLAITALVLCIASCGGGGGGGSVATQPAPEAVGRVVTMSVVSANTHFPYPISIFLPQSYDSGTLSYPVIYATEGDAPYGNVTGSGAPLTSTGSRFDTFKTVMQQRGTQAILVGIGGTARRDTDFLLPTAIAYRDFIVKELVPRIESTYRVDPTRRALSGLSHGGYFVNLVLFNEGTAGTLNFSHYLSTESSTGGTVNTDALFQLEQQMADAGRPLPVTLLLAAGAPGGTTNHDLVVALYDRMAARHYPGLALFKSEFATTHVGTDVPAFEDALKRFFP